MIDFNTSANLPINKGFDPVSNSLRGAGELRAISHEDFGTMFTSKSVNDFTSAFYGDGPYSLEHPNNTTEFVAQVYDYLA